MSLILLDVQLQDEKEGRVEHISTTGAALYAQWYEVICVWKEHALYPFSLRKDLARPVFVRLRLPWPHSSYYQLPYTRQRSNPRFSLKPTTGSWQGTRPNWWWIYWDSIFVLYVRSNRATETHSASHPLPEIPSTDWLPLRQDRLRARTPKL